MKVECVEARLGLGAGSPTGLLLILVFRWSAEGQDRSASLVCGHSHSGSFLRSACWAVWRALSFVCVCSNYIHITFLKIVPQFMDVPEFVCLFPIFLSLHFILASFN